MKTLQSSSVLGAALRVALAIAALTVASLSASAQEAPVPTRTVKSALDDLRDELRRTQESLEAVRRDQLNYRIEKELLKETYSSNLQTVNIVITLILGTFTLLGFLGVRSISNLRQEFRSELDKVTALRSRFEQKFAEIDAELQKARGKFEDLATVNEQQDRRLRILEIQEKVSSLISQGNHRLALEYAEVGLQLAPGDVTLLRYRADCLMKLSRLTEALTCLEEILRLEPRDVQAIANSTEVNLLTSRFDNSDRLLASHRDALTARYGVYLTWYLAALKYFLTGDEPALRQHARNQPTATEVAKAERIRGWRYAEARPVISERENSRAKLLMLKILDFLEGNLSSEELSEAVGGEG